ncbi:MAG: hypothetical protein NTW02_14520 [Cyanobium sp. LacPavin_0920_WC12_MAG_62_9]|nr:hypothetical protein [Cyanobium sp. LacPavin_0920_WC12_MAG_62_9]
MLDLCQRAPEPVLVVPSGSIAHDHGRDLCLQLRALSNTIKICWLIDLAQPPVLAAALCTMRWWPSARASVTRTQRFCSQLKTCCSSPGVKRDLGDKSGSPIGAIKLRS